MIFFKPDVKMVDWIVQYANKRLLFDIGAGPELHLAKALIGGGINNMVIIEPDIDPTTMVLFRSKHIDKSVHILSGTVERFKDMIINHPTMGSLVLFVRPCHSDFVEFTLSQMKPGMEALYITVPENFDKYNDLGDFKNQAELIQHEGTSEDNEVVYSIKIK